MGIKRITGVQGVPRFLRGLILGLCFLTLPTIAQASEVASFRISQVCAIEPDFTAFVEILDANDNLVMDVQKDQLTASLGDKPLKIKEITKFQTGEGVAYILLVDISKSLTEKEFAQMRKVVQSWVDGMNPQDRAAIITFGTKVKRLQDFTDKKLLLKNTIARLKPTDKQTQLHAGLAEAMNLGSRADPNLPSRRVIITLSDGQDDYAGGMTEQEVFNQMKVNPVPIYAIGYYRPPRRLKKEEYLKKLGAFARTSGGSYFRAQTNTIPQMFTRMRQRIRDVYQVELLCPDCKWDGVVRRLQMTYKKGPRVLTAGLDMRLLKRIDLPLKTGGEYSTTETPTGVGFWDKIPTWIYLGGGLVLVGIIILVIVMVANQGGDRVPVQGPLMSSGPDREDEGGSYQTVQGAPTRAVPVPPGGVKAVKPKVAPTPPVSSGKNLRFTVIRGDVNRPPYEVNLTERLVMGRDANCDLPLVDDKEVSRNHCELTLEDDVIRIVDLGSKNGTLVNGVPISGSYQLQNDDIILVGKTEMRLTIT